jgi:hypothetical protein
VSSFRRGSHTCFTRSSKTFNRPSTDTALADTTPSRHRFRMCSGLVAIRLTCRGC